MRAHLERLTGQSLRITRFGWWQMTLLAPFWELARELREMRYLYDLPHAIDAGPLTQVLPDFRFTPLDTVLAEHIAHLTHVHGNPNMAEMG